MATSIFVGLGGFSGWKLLQRNADQNIKTLERDSQFARGRDYFLAHAERVKTADDLMCDYRMLSFVLKSVGLEADIGHRHLIKTIIEADPDDKSSIINRMTDKRYRKLNDLMRDVMSQTGDRVSARNKVVEGNQREDYLQRVGAQDGNLRIALYVQDELASLGSRKSTENTKWYEILASKPLRAAFEGALGFSSSIGKLPLERQVVEFGTQLQRKLGVNSLSEFSDPSKVEALVQRFLLRSTIAPNASQNRFSAALTLLSPRR